MNRVTALFFVISSMVVIAGCANNAKPDKIQGEVLSTSLGSGNGLAVYSVELDGEVDGTRGSTHILNIDPTSFFKIANVLSGESDTSRCYVRMDKDEYGQYHVREIAYYRYLVVERSDGSIGVEHLWTFRSDYSTAKN